MSIKKIKEINKVVMVILVMLLSVSCGDSKDDSKDDPKDNSIIQWGTSNSDLGKTAVLYNENLFVGAQNVVEDKDNILLTKFDKDGKKLWEKSYENDNELSIIDIKVLNDSIYIFADLSIIVFPGELPIIDDAILILKTDMDGKEIQSKTILEVDSEYSRRVVDVEVKDNKFYLLGDTLGNLDNSQFLDNKDLFITILSEDGTQLDKKIWGTSKDDYAYSFIFDETKANLYVTGLTTGKFEDSNIPLGERDVFITRITGTEPVWTKLLGTNKDDSIKDVKVVDGKIYLLGDTLGTIEATVGKRDIFLAKMSIDGTFEWKKQFGTSEDDFSTSLFVDDSIYILGDTLGKFDTANGNSDIFLMNLDKDGTTISTKQFGTSEDDFSFFLTKQNDKLYLLGNTMGAFTNSLGDTDLFLIIE